MFSETRNITHSDEKVIYLLSQTLFFTKNATNFVTDPKQYGFRTNTNPPLHLPDSIVKSYHSYQFQQQINHQRFIEIQRLDSQQCSFARRAGQILV